MPDKFFEQHKEKILKRKGTDNLIYYLISHIRRAQEYMFNFFHIHLRYSQFETKNRKIKIKIYADNIKLKLNKIFFETKMIKNNAVKKCISTYQLVVKKFHKYHNKKNFKVIIIKINKNALYNNF